MIETLVSWWMQTPMIEGGEHVVQSHESWYAIFIDIFAVLMMMFMIVDAVIRIVLAQLGRLVTHLAEQRGVYEKNELSGAEGEEPVLLQYQKGRTLSDYRTLGWVVLGITIAALSVGTTPELIAASVAFTMTVAILPVAVIIRCLTYVHLIIAFALTMTGNLTVLHVHGDEDDGSG